MARHAASGCERSSRTRAKRRPRLAGCLTDARGPVRGPQGTVRRRCPPRAGRGAPPSHSPACGAQSGPWLQAARAPLLRRARPQPGGRRRAGRRHWRRRRRRRAPRRPPLDGLRRLTVRRDRRPAAGRPSAPCGASCTTLPSRRRPRSWTAPALPAPRPGGRGDDARASAGELGFGPGRDSWRGSCATTCGPGSSMRTGHVTDHAVRRSWPTSMAMSCRSCS